MRFTEGTMGVEIATENGVPMLVIDGQRTPLVSFFGNYSDVDEKGRETTCDTMKMSADVAGVHIHSVNMRLPWNQPAGAPEHQEVDRVINRLLEADPNTKLVIRFHSHPVKAFGEGGHSGLDPEKAFGERYHGELTRSNNRTLDYISFASETWERELLSSVENLINHFLSQPYCDSILAIHPDNNEWFYPVDYYEIGDFSEPMLRTWREYVRSRYENTDALSRHWGDSFSFANIEVPTLEERTAPDGASILDPQQARRILDFNQFYNELVADLIIRIGKTIKRASGNRYLALFFYGYLFEISNNYRHGTQQSGHCALHKVLASEHIDMLAGPISYFERWDVAEDGGSYFMCPVDSITANGKIWIQEDDARTYLKTGDGVLTPAKSLKATLNIARKNAANSIVHNTGTWFMDLPAEGWLKDPRIWQEISRLKSIYRGLCEQDKVRPVHSEVAVIVDEKSIYAMTASNALMQSLLYRNRYFLSRLGVTCGYYLMSDLVGGRVPKARVYVFLNAIEVSADERRYIGETLKQQECTLLWVYASGLIDGDTANCGNIEALTGLSVGQLAQPENPAIRMTENAVFSDSSMLQEAVIPYSLSAFNPGPLSESQEVSPLFYVTDDCDALGAYDNNQKVAIGLKKTGAATSVFYGSPLLSTRFLINLCKSSKVHLYSDTGHDFILNNRHFFAISAEAEGRKQIQLPQISDVYDLSCNELLVKGTRDLEFEMARNETKLLGVDFSL